MFKGAHWQAFATGIQTVVDGEVVGDGIVEFQEKNGVIFIPRHGNEIRYSPSRTQYKANVVAAAIMGAKVVVATSAVGSLHPEIGVESLVIPESYVDETARDGNLFGTGITVHASSSPEFSYVLQRDLEIIARGMEKKFKGVHTYKTYVCIPGDRFGTDAEGKKRAQYADVVGMTLCPEASLAMQAGLEYAAVAFVVDNDRDANHKGGTLKVMDKLSAPDRVPTYIAKVVRAAKRRAQEDRGIEQLAGNVIPGDLTRIKNPNVRFIAESLVRRYVN